MFTWFSTWIYLSQIDSDEGKLKKALQTEKQLKCIGIINHKKGKKEAKRIFKLIIRKKADYVMTKKRQ